MLTHEASDHWAFASFALPERSDALWIVRVTYHARKEPQLIVGIIEETQDSGLIIEHRSPVDEVNYETFLGSDKNTWGYKTTGQLYGFHSPNDWLDFTAISAQAT